MYRNYILGEINNRQAPDTLSVTSRQSTTSRQSAVSNTSRQSADTFGGNASLNSESTVEDTWQPEPASKRFGSVRGQSGGQNSLPTYSQVSRSVASLELVK